MTELSKTVLAESESPSVRPETWGRSARELAEQVSDLEDTIKAVRIQIKGALASKFRDLDWRKIAVSEAQRVEARENELEDLRDALRQIEELNPR